MTNNRIVSIQGGEVTFNYRDRRSENKVKEKTVKAHELIRRYLLHILPKGFMKIRYFCFLAHTNKKASISLLRQLIDPEEEVVEKQTETIEETMLRLTGVDFLSVRNVEKEQMICVKVLPNPLLDTS